jgi:outer membrane protein assembly factor BamE (lipoprotein component of BamABCDE complex)
MKKILFLILISIFIPSCVNKGITKNGYSIDKNDVEQIKIGVSDKDSVINLLDYPTATDASNQNKWIYCSYKTKKIMFFKPKIIEQDVLVISFDNENFVKNIEKYNLTNSKSVNISNNRTNINSREKGIVSDIMNNIGTVTPGI